jgi:thiamine-phosphate pyrophosphorylase
VLTIMDLKLLAWGLRRNPAPLPHLWLFTDEQRLPDPRAAVAGLPRGKAGVVLRHDHDPARAELGRDLALICRTRRLVLVVAGNTRLAARLQAGVHLRGGYWPNPIRPAGPVTSSAHSVRDLRRARRAGADLVFLSPAFPTASHAGAPGLGPLRWAAIARHGGGATIAALGGVDGRSVMRLPARLCGAVGAIGALSVSAPAIPAPAIPAPAIPAPAIPERTGPGHVQARSREK